MHRNTTILAVGFVLTLLAPAISAAPDVHVRKVEGKIAKDDAIAFASGSGLMVGKRLILTNRHVVQDDNGKEYEGFRVYSGPDFKTRIDARVVAICENYDLAMLERDITESCGRGS